MQNYSNSNYSNSKICSMNLNLTNCYLSLIDYWNYWNLTSCYLSLSCYSTSLTMKNLTNWSWSWSFWSLMTNYYSSLKMNYLTIRRTQAPTEDLIIIWWLPILEFLHTVLHYL